MLPQVLGPLPPSWKNCMAFLAPGLLPHPGTARVDDRGNESVNGRAFRFCISVFQINQSMSF